MRSLLLNSLSILFVSATANCLMCQTVTGTLSGVVTDASGAVVPAAHITAIQNQTGLERTAVTGTSGAYVVPLLPAGTYTVSVAATGFRDAARTGIQLNADSRIEVNLSLAVGDASEKVQVTATAPLVGTADATMGEVVETRRIEELPLNGRNFAQLIQLAAGVTNGRPGEVAGNSVIENFRGTFTFNSNGLRSASNNYLIDGVDNNEGLFNAGGIVIEPVVDAIQEFKVSTTNMPAEFGRTAGGVVSINTKPGTNEFHGVLFEFLRNDAFDANTFFANAAGTSKPPLRQNQFGGTLGGPILHNRTFFFVDYQGFQVRNGLTYLASVPTLGARNGDFSGPGNPAIYDPATASPDGKGGLLLSAFPGKQIPVTRFDPIARALLNLFPLPNTNGNATTLNFINAPLQRREDDQFDVRVDHRVGSAGNFFARYSWSNAHQLFPNELYSQTDPFGGGAKGNDLTVVPQGLTLNYVHGFSARLLSESRFGFSRLYFDGNPLGFGNAKFNDIQIPNQRISNQVGVIPTISVSGLTGLGPQGNVPNIGAQNIFQVYQAVSFVTNKHTIKVGVDILRRQRNNNFSSSPAGSISFSGAYTSATATSGGAPVADFLLGLPVSLSRSYLSGTFGRREVAFSAFAQDDYKISRQLTLNFGVRYDLWTPSVEVADRQTNFDPVSGLLIPASSNGPLGRSLYRSDDNNLQPRIGLAYDLNGNGKTVLRSGYGISTLEDLNAGATLLNFNPPFSTTQQITNATGSIPAAGLSSGFPVLTIPSLQNPSGTIRSIDPGFRAAYVQTWSLEIQQSLSANTLLSLAYVGSKGTRLPGRIDLNQPVPAPGNVNAHRPYYAVDSNLGTVDTLLSDVNSTYHSLQMKIDRHFSNGLNFLANYTWGHAIEGSEGPFESATPGSSVQTMPQDNHNRRAEKASTSYDVRHRVVFSYGYELPFGKGKRFLDTGVPAAVLGNWKLQGLTTFAAGNPITLVVSSSNLNTGSGTQRPNRSCDGNLSSSQRSINRWFDTSCFTVPSLYTFGNSGRDIITSPGLSTSDASLIKDVPIRERMRIQFRAEAFNIMNKPQFWPPNNALGPSSFGKISATRLGTNRQLQLALKLLF
jgi:hypothetical protein